MPIPTPRPRHLAAALALAAVVTTTSIVVVGHDGATPAAAAPTAASPPPAVGDAAPSYAVRSVPSYATYTRWAVRTSPGDGPIDFVASIPTGAASTPLYGDWDGNGTFTPGYFLDGTWVLYDRMVGTPVAWRSFTFGRKGDAAVVGDWNGDRRTDIGIVRAGTWYQRDDVTAGPSSRSFTYGIASDRPLAGDWDGDGTDAVGVRRGNVFYLRNANSLGGSHHQFTFGRATDTPVVGDWDGNRSDTVGVVRSSSAWYLATAHTSSAAATAVSVTSGGGGFALPYPSPAGPAGDACPTILPGLTPTAQNLVREPAGLGRTMPRDAHRSALLDGAKTMLGVEYGTDYASRTGLKYLNVRADAVAEEAAVRGPGMSALTVAVGLAMDGYDAAHVGESRAFAVAYVDWLVRSTACQHRSLSPGGWGHTWQSAMWTGFLGLAAWLVWDDLSPQARAYVAHVMVDEAEWVVVRGVPYWKDRAGTTQPGRTGNSAAEEAAWDAGHLGLAMQMLAGHPRAEAWARKGTQLGVAAYSTRPDTQSGTRVNGIALRDRLAGFNAFDDGTVENHGGIQVDYIAVAQYSWWARVYGALAGRPVPEGFTHNSRLGWGAITKLVFGSPPFAPPGGIVYKPDGTTYYPDVASWGTLRYPQWLAYDATAGLVGADVDPTTAAVDTPPAVIWFDRHTARTRELQLRHADGHIYEPGEEGYVRAEELNAQLIAMGWAARYVDRHLPDAVSTGLVPLP